ncbi:DUF2065 domain-containing protein [Ectothiorhodospiraceae bacterium 2226]|nr:DUF2065 domain-containing protein [Ectothiorhodospiraceae bacterium 2226]
MWQELLIALALLLVLEGVMPFLSPAGFRRTLMQMASIPESALRWAGLASMLLGAFLIYALRGA